MENQNFLVSFHVAWVGRALPPGSKRIHMTQAYPMRLYTPLAAVISLLWHVTPARPTRENSGTFAGKIRKQMVSHFAVVAKQEVVSSSTWGEHA